MKYIILIVLVLIVIIEYACMAVSEKADEQAEELYRRYKRSKDDAFSEGHTPWNSRAKWCPLKEVKGADNE